MWVPQYNAYLGVRCSHCNTPLEGELSDSAGYTEQTIVVVVECDCTQELKNKIADLTEQVEELEEKNNGEADS